MQAKRRLDALAQSPAPHEPRSVGSQASPGALAAAAGPAAERRVVHVDPAADVAVEDQVVALRILAQLAARRSGSSVPVGSWNSAGTWSVTS